MDAGELLTRSTVWISIAFYTIGCVIFALGTKRPNLDNWSRLAFTAAVTALIAHYVSAFHFFHGWSHRAAYVETARQTAEVFRVNWGGGIFINYALLMLWIADVGWWWLAGLDSYRRRSWLLLLGWHGFLIFIIFNATVVFKDGIQRWIGLLICSLLCVSWIVLIRQRSYSVSGRVGIADGHD